MNIYKILIMSYGNSQEFIVQAYDASQAMMNNGINPSEVISLKLVGSANKTNNAIEVYTL